MLHIITLLQKVIYARHRNDLFITLKFHISSQRLPLKLSKLLTLPVPTSRNVTTTMKATQLLSLLSFYPKVFCNYMAS